MLVASTRAFSHSLPTVVANEVADELDASTLALCSEGKRAALEQFVRCYERRVFAFLSRALTPSPNFAERAVDTMRASARATAKSLARMTSGARD